MLFFYVEILMFKENNRILAVLSVRDRAVFYLFPKMTFIKRPFPSTWKPIK